MPSKKDQELAKMAKSIAKQSESVRVVVRVRPMSKQEKKDDRMRAVTVHEEINDAGQGQIELKNPKADDREPPKLFTFDKAYGPTSKQRDIYDQVAAPIVDAVMNGYNGTMFAYGQTGAGKSFTMEGEPDKPELQGVIPNSFRHIFDHIKGNTSKAKQ